MGRPRGSIGDTKLKLLAILHYNEKTGEFSYGYGIWKMMNQRYNCCLGEDGLRNVYHHLENLHNLGLVVKNSNHLVEGAPERHLYGLTTKGRSLHREYEQYMIPSANTSQRSDQDPL